MFNRIDFSDLYRFITSIGLISIAFSFFLPWLYSTNNDSLISTVEYSNLVESAKHLVDKQLELNTRIVDSIFLVSLGFLIFGLILSSIGIWKWKQKQDSIDETDRINLADLRLEKLNKKEVKEKAEEEVKEEVEHEENNVEKSPKFKVNFEALSKSLMELEDQFFKRILEYNTFEYEPVSNVKIDNRYQADILLRSFDLNRNQDVLIEIKYLQKGLNMSLVRNAFDRLKLMYGQYYTKTRRHARLVLIVVYKGEGVSEKQVERFLTAIEDFRKQAGQRHFRLFVMNEFEAMKFDIEKLF